MNKGDLIGDCTACDAKDAVHYYGDNEAVCRMCGIIFTVDFEEEQVATAELPVAPVVESRPYEPRFVEQQVQPEQPGAVPEYILNSRPWRWAHEYKNTGNPYRADSKSFIVFDEIVKASDGITIVELLQKLGNMVIKKPSFLLTVYEVVAQCVMAGLLVLDTGNGKLTVCKSNPKPATLP